VTRSIVRKAESTAVNAKAIVAISTRRDQCILEYRRAGLMEDAAGNGC
jgi:hypothetical protein